MIVVFVLQCVNLLETGDGVISFLKEKVTKENMFYTEPQLIDNGAASKEDCFLLQPPIEAKKGRKTGLEFNEQELNNAIIKLKQ